MTTHVLPDASHYCPMLHPMLAYTLSSSGGDRGPSPRRHKRSTVTVIPALIRTLDQAKLGLLPVESRGGLTTSAAGVLFDEAADSPRNTGGVPEGVPRRRSCRRQPLARKATAENLNALYRQHGSGRTSWRGAALGDGCIMVHRCGGVWLESISHDAYPPPETPGEDERENCGCDSSPSPPPTAGDIAAAAPPRRRAKRPPAEPDTADASPLLSSSTRGDGAVRRGGQSPRGILRATDSAAAARKNVSFKGMTDLEEVIWC